MKEEQKFWKLLKPHLPGDVSRIENIADNGTPDVSGAAYLTDYWIELKVCSNKTKYRDVVSLLRDDQLVWHHRRGRYGSTIFVAVKYHIMKRILLYKYDFGRKWYSLIGNIMYHGGYDWDEFEHIFILHLTKGI